MKNSIILSILIISLSLISCKTTIPERDTVIPTMYFTLNGGGLQNNEIVVDENFAFDTQALYLARGVEYNLLLSGKDAGGVAQVLFELPNNAVVQIVDPIPTPWTETSGTISTRILQANGSSADPRSSILLGLKIVGLGVDVVSTDFDFKVTDFHGNPFHKTLRVIIGEFGTRIGPR